MRCGIAEGRGEEGDADFGARTIIGGRHGRGWPGEEREKQLSNYTGMSDSIAQRSTNWGSLLCKGSVDGYYSILSSCAKSALPCNNTKYPNILMLNICSDM